MSCLFCDDGHKIVYKTGRWFVRLDNYPANPGHVEVVPCRHVESYWDLTDQEAAERYQVERQARAVIEAEYGTPDGWTIGINDGPASGGTFRHVHIHLIPRWKGDVPKPDGGIRQCAPNWNPAAWTTPKSEAVRPGPAEDPAEIIDRTMRWTDTTGIEWDLAMQYTDTGGFLWHWAGGFASADGTAEALIPLMARNDWSIEAPLNEVIDAHGALESTGELHPAYRWQRVTQP